MNKASSSDNRSDNCSDNRTNNQNSSGAKTGNNQNNNVHSKNKDQKKPTPPANTPSSSSGTKPNSIADMLGPDGKLKPEERQRRLDNNLCLHCAKFGHTVPNCPIQSKAKPKGRAATVAATPNVAAAPATGTASGCSGKA